MKVLCIMPYYFPAFQYGGPIASVHGLNKAMVDSGVNVTVYTTNAGLEGEVQIDGEVDVSGVRVTYFSLKNLFGFSSGTYWQFSIGMTKALSSNIRKFDLIYVNGMWNYPGTVSCYYSRRFVNLLSPASHP